MTFRHATIDLAFGSHHRQINDQFSDLILVYWSSIDSIYLPSRPSHSLGFPIFLIISALLLCCFFFVFFFFSFSLEANTHLRYIRRSCWHCFKIYPNLNTFTAAILDLNHHHLFPVSISYETLFQFTFCSQHSSKPSGNTAQIMLTFGSKP